MHTWIQNRWSRSLALLLFCWDKSPRFCINIPWSKLCKRTMRIFPISNKSILILTIMLWSYLAGQMVFRPSLARSSLKLLASEARQGGRIFIRDFFQGFSEILLNDFWNFSEAFFPHNRKSIHSCLSDINYTLFLSRLVHEAFQFLTMKRKKKKDIPAKFWTITSCSVQ